ncbi:MAG: ATP-binding cassette domain-containing protein [Chromatiales bacterium]|nr:ATP-binding cassette domain-containing protein [Chromatiales bacterium]
MPVQNHSAADPVIQRVLPLIGFENLRPKPARMASVEFSKVTKIYPNGHQAILDLDLSIDDGELMIVVGPSGSGKSTLLRLLAGLEEISRGQILIGGRVANHLTPQERNIAMVFQDCALHPNMTVRGNLEFPQDAQAFQALKSDSGSSG